MAELSAAGHHIAAMLETDPVKVLLFLKLEKSLEYTYPPAFILPKLSILAMYHRVFTTWPHRVTVFALASILIVTEVMSFFLTTFDCRPFAYYWNKTIPGGHCLDLNAIYQYFNLPNIVTDVVMLILPQSVVWRLCVTRNQKIGLAIAFLTGSM